MVLPPELGPFEQLWPWLVAIGGVIGGAYALNRYVGRRQPKVTPLQKLKDLQRRLKNKPKPVIGTEMRGEASLPPKDVKPSKDAGEKKLLLERRVRDYHVEPEPDVLEK